MRKEYSKPKFQKVEIEVSSILCESSSDLSRIMYYNNEEGRGRNVTTKDAL